MTRAVWMAMTLTAVAACSAAAPDEAPAQTSQRAVAVVATGCFWCTEADFDKVPGVLATTSGYIGGRTANPTYEQVSAGNSGHIEALRGAASALLSRLGRGRKSPTAGGKVGRLS